jgi:hypothetical protein
MQISTGHQHEDRYGLLSDHPKQSVLQPSKSFTNRPAVVGTAPAPEASSTFSARTYSSYAIQNTFPRNAIMAYQRSARFEMSQSIPLPSAGDRFWGNIRQNESALTKILQEEPENRAAWYDMGILYHQQGERNKVSEVYQILNDLDIQIADRFSIQLGLDEKLLLDVI